MHLSEKAGHLSLPDSGSCCVSRERCCASQKYWSSTKVSEQCSCVAEHSIDLPANAATSAVDLDTDKAIQEIIRGPQFAHVTMLTIASVPPFCGSLWHTS